VVLFSGPLGQNSRPRADFEEVRRRAILLLGRWSISRGDELVIADVGDLAAADYAHSMGASVRILLDDDSPPPAFTSLLEPGYTDIMDRSTVQVASQIWPPDSPRSLANRRNQWMLSYAEAIGVPAIVIAIADPSTEQLAPRTADLIQRANDQGIEVLRDNGPA
jgi:hypothetical protein